MRTTRSKLLASLAVGAGLIVGTIGIANAQDEPGDEPPATEQAETREAPTDEQSETDEGEEAHEGDLDECVEWLPGPEELAELEAEMAALREAFDAAGIAYEEVSDDELGITFIEWDVEDDAANEVAEGVFDELYGDELFDDEFPEECEVIVFDGCDDLDDEGEDADDADDEDEPAAA